MEETEFEFEKVFNIEDYFIIYGPLLTQEVNEVQSNFIEEALQLEKGSKILDLCCGFGRITNILAEKSYSMSGLDNSAGFLEIARKEAEKKQLKVNYYQDDLRNLKFDEEFDAVINIFTSFGYFSDEDNFKVLQGISHSLKKGGKFFLDMFNREYILKNYLPYVVTKREEGYIAEINSFDIINSRNCTERILFRDGIIKKANFFVRAYTFTEMKNLLSKVGLKVTMTYGNFKIDEPYTLNSRRMIVVAIKV
ncbi:MAG: hypothetical protein DDT22_00618 [candidate division WS2 bacterium]|nr:hypothetical protein [Candidatus Lithacetigena glycinireducens]